MQGSLPWEGLEMSGVGLKPNKIMAKKQNANLSELFKGYPDEFMRYIIYVKSLNFEEEPDYRYLRELIQSAAIKEDISLTDFID